MAAALAAKILPFDLFETRRLVGAAVGIIGLFVDVADRPPPRRPARRADRARPARDLPALLRPHVHERRRTRPSRSRWLSCCSAWCARSTNIRSPSARTIGACRHRPRPGVRLAHPRRRGRADYRACRLAAHRRCRGQPDGVRHARRACRAFRLPRLLPAAGVRLPDHGPALAVVGAGSAQSVARGGILRNSSKSRGGNCSTAS